MKTPYQPGSFWGSKLKDAHTCLTLYELKYIKGLQLESKSLDSECGTALHIGINEILANEGPGIETALLYWDTVKDANLPRFSYSWEELRFCLTEWIRKFKSKHVSRFKPFKMEERIYVKVGENAMEGTPDFLGDFDGVPSVLDFKTASSRYSELKTISDFQIPSYADLAYREYGYKAEQGVHFVFVKDRKAPAIQTPIKVKLTEAVRSSTMSSMQAQIEDLKARKVFYKNPQSCVRGTIICPAFSICHPEVKDE